MATELGEAACRVLWMCRRQGEGGACQAEMSAMLDLSAAQTSALVEGLRLRGLASSERRPPDRRRQFWRLTPRGAELFGRLCAELDAHMEVRS